MSVRAVVWSGTATGGMAEQEIIIIVIIIFIGKLIFGKYSLRKMTN